MLFIFIIVGISLFQSCCNIKECDSSTYPSIYFNIYGFVQEERLSAEFHIIRLSDSSIIETQDLGFFPATGDVLATTFLIWGRSDFDLRDYFFVMNTINSTDTITNVSYTSLTNQIKCPDCNPYGLNYGQIIDFTNFSCEVNGQVQTNLDDIRIEKK
ncbi:MAG: hypothetical protein ACPGD5_07310 [Salibacteraceae bacterium]